MCVYNSNYIIFTETLFLYLHTYSKSKALSYLRSAPADPAEPLQLDGELHVKITFIDSKRSPDRTWRAVHAELRGTTLTMTIHREGKSNQVSFCYYVMAFFILFFKVLEYDMWYKNIT